MVIDRFEDSRIKDTRIIMDMLGLMVQLGVFPKRLISVRLTSAIASGHRVRAQSRLHSRIGKEVLP